MKQIDAKLVIWAITLVFIAGGGWWSLQSVSANVSQIQATLDEQTTQVTVHMPSPEAHDDIKLISPSSADTIHTHGGTNNGSAFDEVHLWVVNSHTSSVTVNLQWGGSTAPDNIIDIPIASASFLKIIDGMHIGGDLSISSTASVANKAVVYGYVISHVFTTESPNPTHDFGDTFADR